MTNAVLDGFSNTNHHRSSSAQAQAMRFAMHHQPFVCLALEWTDIVSDLVVENLAASAGHGIETGRLQSRKDLAHGYFRDAGNIQDFRRREAMTVNLKTGFDS